MPQTSPWKRIVSSPRGKGVIAIVLLLIAVWGANRLWNSRTGLLSDDHHDLPKELPARQAQDASQVGKYLEQAWRYNEAQLPALAARLNDPANPYHSLRITENEVKTAADFAVAKAQMAAKLGGVRVDEQAIRALVTTAFQQCAAKGEENCTVTTPDIALEGGNEMHFAFHIEPTQVLGTRLGLVDMKAIFKATDDKDQLRVLRLNQDRSIAERMAAGEEYVSATMDIVPNLGGAASFPVSVPNGQPEVYGRAPSTMKGPGT